MNPLLEVLCNEINKLKKALTTTGSDYTATVTKVEGDTAYVQIAGSDISDTPVALSVNAAEGDHVRVRVANGKAWITGNDTLPPSNDKKEVGTKMMKNMSDRDDDIIIDFGKMKFIGNTLVVDSDNFKLDEDGNAQFGGTLDAAGGTFTGELRINGDYVGYGDQTVFISPTGMAPIRVYAEPELNVDAGVTLGATDFRMTYDDNRLESERHNILIVSAQSAEFYDFGNRYISTYIDKNAMRVRNNSSWTDYGYDGAHSTSDIRLKEDITTIDPKTAKHLLPVQFRFKGDDKLHYGFIAQDVQKVMPDTVQEGENGYLTLTYHELIAPLYALVQEQEDRINQLEARLKALEEKK